MKLITPLLAGAALASVITSSSGQSLIFNGDFEQPVVSCCAFFDPGSTGIPGWIVTGTGDVGVDDASWGGPAQHGLQYLDLSGGTGTTGRGNAGVSQTFATAVGQSYSLTFYRGSAWQVSPGFVFEVSIAGQTYQFGETPGQQGADLAWTQETIPFTASEVTTTLAFSNITGWDSNNNFIDNVSVTAVPEPEHYAACMAAALVGFGLWRRTKRNA